MSDDSRMELYETKAELIETKEELEKIRKDYEVLKSQMTVNSLTKIVDNFQAQFSRRLEEIQENFNALSIRVSNNENTSSEVKINNDIQTRTISKSLAIVQGDLTTLPANMAISSARVLNHDQTQYEIKETLRKINEISNKQNETIGILNTNIKTILLLGGHDGKNELDSLFILENYRNNWKELNIKLPYAVLDHGAQFLNNNLYIFGGYNESSKQLNWTYKLSKSLQWEKMADMNKKRRGISNSNVILNNQIWVCGGHNGNETLNSVEMYDPKTNQWKHMKHMNKCRESAATAVVNGKIFCAGGVGINLVECYDSSSDVWTPICNLSRLIEGHGTVEINGKLIVMGGFSGKYLNNVWELDTTDTNAEWINKPSMSIPRRWFSIAKVDGNIFVCGGNSNGRSIDDVEIFDGEFWRNGPKMTANRVQAAAVVIPINFFEVFEANEDSLNTLYARVSKNEETFSKMIMNNDTQSKTISASLEVVQKDMAALSDNFNTLSARVANNYDTFSNMVNNSDTQSRTISNNLVIVQRDVTTLSENLNTLSENVNYLSTRVSNNDETLSEIRDTLRQQNEALNKLNEALKKQNETIQILKTNAEIEKILLLGGHDGKNELDSLLILENKRNKWKQLNIKLPYAVHNHGAKLVNDHLYIFGGYGKEGPLDITYRLSKSLQWKKMANMNQKRSGISNSSVILNNQIWVCGGWNEKGDYLKSVEMYDPERNKWKYMKEMNDYRRDAAAAVVNGKIFCSSSNSVECYDPSSDIWTRICNILQEIWEHGAVEMNDSFIVMGGFSVNYLENVWTLDTTDTNAEWIEKPSMSIPRSGFSIAKVDDKIFVCGGETEKEDKLETSDLVEIFDGEIWRNGPKVPTPRKNAPTVVIPKKFARYLN